MFQSLISDRVQIIDWEWGNWRNMDYDIGAYFAGLASKYFSLVHFTSTGSYYWSLLKCRKSIK